jgi:predicted dienelactone hydrolase
MIIRAMTFVPKNLDRTKKQPLVVFAHQGIHSDFGHDYEYGAVKELVQQGYSVIGPDYRGSTGYGAAFYNEIDYGGLEVDDVFAARVGMIGWSHGGFITLMNPAAPWRIRGGLRGCARDRSGAAPRLSRSGVSGDLLGAPWRRNQYTTFINSWPAI